MAKEEGRRNGPKTEAEVETIERSLFIAAPPEIVFDFLLKPELLARWIGRSRRREPKFGDPFILEFLDSGYIVRGAYREVSPPQRVVFTWGWEGRDDLPPGASLVEIDLEPRDGGTLLRLRHSGLPKAARHPFTPASHSEHWGRYLARLQSQASAH